MTPVAATPPPAPAAKLSLRQLCAYGTGGVLYEWGLFGVKNTANQVLNIVLGMNPAAMGTVMALGRLWDAFIDPLMGSVSDNFRSRWGRRRPLIAAGAIGCGIFFPLIWWLPLGAGATLQVAWLLAATLLFYSAFAVFVVPYQALGYELTPDYHEKTRLFSFRQGLGAFTGLAVAWVFPLIQSGWLGTPGESVRWLALLVGVLIILAGITPALFVRESAVVVPVRTQRKVPLREAFTHAMRSRPFLLVAGASGLALMA